uniref:Uncharacterized protein n=1 Tax=Arundo donax TaxID=35708 RepID=A0A0A9FHA4_ARUDO
MPRGGFSGSLTSPKIDVVIDMGNPFLNRTVDGFLKIGAVGACKVAAEETFECLNRGDVSKHKLEHALKKMCKEGAYWVLLLVFMWAWSMELNGSMVALTGRMR